MIIDKDMNVCKLKQEIQKGVDHFYRVDFGEGSYCGSSLENVIFEECILSIDLSKSKLHNVKFISSNIKGCIFELSNIKNVAIEKCSVEGINMKGAIIEGLIFEGNYCYGKMLNQNDLGLFV